MMKKILPLTFMLTAITTTLFAGEIQVINTTKAPAPIGTYSQAVKSNSTIYLSGQIGINPKSGQLISHNFKEQVNQVFKNINEVAKA